MTLLPRLRVRRGSSMGYNSSRAAGGSCFDGGGAVAPRGTAGIEEGFECRAHRGSGSGR
jgi:hypothetical protein